MKVLFVSAGSEEGLPGTVVRHQGESLISHGMDVSFFCTEGRGVKAYLKAVPRLRRELKKSNPDIVHAHYSFSGYLAAISGATPLVVSLMGSDVGMSLIFRLLTKLFASFFWDRTIVKSQSMIQMSGIRKACVLPNGVNTDLFRPYDKTESCRMSGLSSRKKIILFASSPERPEKNFPLAEKAFGMLNETDVSLVTVYGKPADEMVWYINSADLLLLTSVREGSPNTVKEALACNIPIVATDVGDVAELLEGVDGCYVSSSADPYEIAAMVREALAYGRKTNGRQKIFGMGLDSGTVAARLEDLYKGLLKTSASHSPNK